MRLKISDLQRVVESTIKEKKDVEDFCNEIKKAFGPTVDVSDDIVKLSEQANDRLNVLERTGRRNYVQFDSRVAKKLVSHKNSEVRKLVARILPLSESFRFLYDNSHTVRIEAAKRAPVYELKRSITKFPHDSSLRELYESRLLRESESALENAAMGPEEDYMSDTWYEKTAKKLVQDYNSAGLDTGWINAAVNQVVSGNRATNRFNVDPMKLYKAVIKHVAEREELAVERALKESVEQRTPFEEFTDPVVELNESSLSASEYVQRANELFKVRFSEVPPAHKKYRLGESTKLFTRIPAVGYLPHNSSVRYDDEIALDRYVKHWNMQQQLSGEPFKLSWSPHPSQQNKISFSLVLK